MVYAISPQMIGVTFDFFDATTSQSMKLKLPIEWLINIEQDIRMTKLSIMNFTKRSIL